MADLSTYSSVQENFFVELNISGAYTRFSDYHKAYTIDGNSYDALGSLLGITNTPTNIRASAEQLGVSISAIPNTNRSIAYDNNIKGASLTVWRAFFDPTTGALISTTEQNPTIKFKGMVTNFSIKETWGDTSTFTLILEVQNILSQLQKQTAGRRTNPLDQKKFYPSDLSMNRVPQLKNANFQFGAPSNAGQTKVVKTGTTGNPHIDTPVTSKTKYRTGNPHR